MPGPLRAKRAVQENSRVTRLMYVKIVLLENIHLKKAWIQSSDVKSAQKVGSLQCLGPQMRITVRSALKGSMQMRLV